MWLWSLGRPGTRAPLYPARSVVRAKIVVDWLKELLDSPPFPAVTPCAIVVLWGALTIARATSIRQFVNIRSPT